MVTLNFSSSSWESFCLTTALSLLGLTLKKCRMYNVVTTSTRKIFISVSILFLQSSDGCRRRECSSPFQSSCEFSSFDVFIEKKYIVWFPKELNKKLYFPLEFPLFWCFFISLWGCFCVPTTLYFLCSSALLRASCGWLWCSLRRSTQLSLLPFQMEWQSPCPFLSRKV